MKRKLLQYEQDFLREDKGADGLQGLCGLPL